MNFSRIKGSFVGGMPSRTNRVVCSKKNDDWQISLGMHNFRKALRIEGSKSQSKTMVCGDKNVGKRVFEEKKKIRAAARCKGKRSRRNKRKRLLKYLRKDKKRYYRLLGRWERSAYKEASSVRVKSRKAIGSFDEESRRLRGALRGVAIRRTGQYWRHIRKMKRENLIPGVAVKLSSESKVNRDSKRKRWLYRNSWLKLPRGYLENTRDSFDKYCIKCKILGHFTAFHLISHWIDPESKRIKETFRKPEIYTIYNGLDFFQAGIIPKEPARGDYVNYKSWITAYEHFFTLIEMAKKDRILLKGVVIRFDKDKLNSYRKKA